MRCFGAAGYHRTRMDDVARAAGLSKGAVYWHFPGKAALFTALFDELMATCEAIWDDLDEAAPLTTLEAGLQTTLEVLSASPERLQLWNELCATAELRPRLLAHRSAGRERLTRLLVRARSRRPIGVTDAEALAAALLACIDGLLLQSLAEPDFDTAAAWRAAWAALRRGLAKDDGLQTR